MLTHSTGAANPCISRIACRFLGAIPYLFGPCFSKYFLIYKTLCVIPYSPCFEGATHHDISTRPPRWRRCLRATLEHHERVRPCRKLQHRRNQAKTQISTPNLSKHRSLPASALRPPHSSQLYRPDLQRECWNGGGGIGKEREWLCEFFVASVMIKLVTDLERITGLYSRLACFDRVIS